MLFDSHAPQSLSLSNRSDWSDSQPLANSKPDQPSGLNRVRIDRSLNRGEALSEADKVSFYPTGDRDRKEANVAAKQLAALRGSEDLPLGIRPQWCWLEEIVERVDTGRAESLVQGLRQQHPHATPRQMGRLIMVKKVIAPARGRVAKNRLSHTTASLLKFLSVDRVSAITSQIEMIYQIAAAYGLPVQEPNRCAEALTLFETLLKGSGASQAGLDIGDKPTRTKTAIAVSVNVTLLYALGYAACHFYEAKLNPSEATRDEPVYAAQAVIESYLSEAIAQQIIMDQILVHMILASTNHRSWSDILPCLKKLKLVPASLAMIAAHIQTPQPLYRLLNQLNSDFAVPLLIQCNKIAQFDGIITPQEAKVLEQIANKFDVDAQAIAL